ncbi:GAF domain-containing protein, partial [bacterium]|nr:GAF domain-containing protein [bacterium]
RLLNMVLDTACSLLKAKSGYLMLIHNQHLRVKVSRGLDANRLASLKLSVGQGIEGRVVQTGKARIIGNLSTVADHVLRGADSNSKMYVPLRVNKKNIGVMALESPKFDAFNRNDLEVFTMLGTQASEVLQTIELYKEMRNKADRLSLLFEVGQDIGTIFNLNRLFATILERSRQVMKAKHGSLMIYEKERNMLGIRASFGLTLDTEQKRISVEQGIAGWVFKRVRSVLIPAVKKSPLYNEEKDHVYAGRNLIACPLSIRKKVFGVICINDRIGGKEFTRDDLDLLNALAAKAAIAIENVELYASLRRDYLNTIKALAAAVDAKDHYTHGHSNKVMAFSAIIAQELGLNEKEIEKIKFSALLHDVGKIGISEGVLNKPSGLTEREFDIIAMHPILGVSIVQNIESLKDLIPIILHHHERYDGGGYPEGKSGYSIPLGARIVAVADAWDVMTSERAYRRALPREFAIAELRKCSGGQFDPEVVKAFLLALKKGLKEKSFEIEEESKDLVWEEDKINRLLE